MASFFLKLVFLLSLVSSFLAAPLRHRPRNAQAPAPAAELVPLKLSAQQDSYNFDLATALVLSNSTLHTLQTVPASCAAYASECTSGYQAVNVTYDDCSDAWTICRCTTANMTMDTAVERLGRVPVGLRRYVATVLVSPDVETHAYTLTSGDIHMFGDTQVDTWVHEAAHAYDWASGIPYSESAEWAEAIGNDTCVPDTYSATNVAEDFAQMTVMMIFSMIHSNSLPTGWSMDCMSHQMQYMSSLPLFNKDNLFGNTCAIVPSDPFSRHAAAPSVTPTRVQPNFPAQPQNTSVVPVVNAAQGTPDSSSRKNNAASSLYHHASNLAALSMSGSVLGWFLA